MGINLGNITTILQVISTSADIVNQITEFAKSLQQEGTEIKVLTPDELRALGQKIADLPDLKDNPDLLK